MTWHSRFEFSIFQKRLLSEILSKILKTISHWAPCVKRLLWHLRTRWVSIWKACQGCSYIYRSQNWQKNTQYKRKKLKLYLRLTWQIWYSHKEWFRTTLLRGKKRSQAVRASPGKPYRTNFQYLFLKDYKKNNSMKHSITIHMPKLQSIYPT